MQTNKLQKRVSANVLISRQETIEPDQGDKCQADYRFP